MPVLGVDETSLEYTDQGAGEPLVFLHGGLSDLRVWDRQRQFFAEDHRTITFSFRHYHPNPPVPEGHSITHETLVDDTVGVLDRLGLAPAHLVGQSTGAFVALLLAHAHPGLVRTLVLAEPPALPLLGLEVPPRPPQIIRLLLRNPGTAVAVARFGMKGLRPTMRAFDVGEDEQGMRTFLSTVIGEDTIAGWPEEKLQRARDNVPAFKAVLAAGMPAFSESNAAAITVPCLLVTGTESTPVLHRITDKLERIMPKAERLDIEGASHLMFEDRPDEFNAAVASFVRRD